jgi:hypothetical protein
MYKNIRLIESVFKPRANFVKNKSKDLLTNPKEIVMRWREYFEEFLSVDSGNFEDSLVSPSSEQHLETTTLDEVKQDLRSLNQNKAPGEDGIVAELLQMEVKALISRLYELILNVWRCEEMPSEWPTGIISVLHK